MYPGQMDVSSGNTTTKSRDPLAATTVIDIAAAIGYLDLLVLNEEYRIQMGIAGRDRARSLYDWRTVIGQYEEIWRELSESALQSTDVDQATISYSAFECFSHFSTTLLSGTATVEFSGSSESSVDEELLCSLATADGVFDRTLLLRIVSHVRHVGQQPIKGIGKYLGVSEANEDVVISHICRLCKYGLLSFSGPRPRPLQEG
jgi:hypothetical protein